MRGNGQGFLDQFRENVEHRRRQTPQRLLRAVYIIVLTAMVGGACTFVDSLTGSRIAALVVGVIGVGLGLIGWLVLLKLVFPDTVEVAPVIVLDTPPSYADIIPPPDKPAVNSPVGHAPQSTSVLWWVFGCLTASILLGCVAPAGILLLFFVAYRDAPSRRGVLIQPVPPVPFSTESINDQMRAIEQQHRQQMEVIQRQQEKVQEEMQRRNEAMRHDMEQRMKSLRMPQPKVR